MYPNDRFQDTGKVSRSVTGVAASASTGGAPAGAWVSDWCFGFSLLNCLPTCKTNVVYIQLEPKEDKLQLQHQQVRPILLSVPAG